MKEKLIQQLDFSGFEEFALGRVEPFGLHLFELFFYLFLGIFVLLTLRSAWRSFAMMIIKPKKDKFLDIVTSSGYVDATCPSCGWKGAVPGFHRVCPKCGSTVVT